MTTCKTGTDHINSLKDGRTVYIDGKLVADVTEHPAFRIPSSPLQRSTIFRRGPRTSS